MMSSPRRLPFQSSKSKADAEKRHYEKVGGVVIVRSNNEQKQAQDCRQNSSHENPRHDRSKTSTTPSKLHRSSTISNCKAPNAPAAVKHLDVLPHTPANRTTHIIEKYISRQLSCPQERKPESSGTLSVPQIKRQNSFDEAQFSSARIEPQIERQRSNISISDDKRLNVSISDDTDYFQCVVDFPYDQDIFALCHLLSKPSSPPIRTSGTVFTDKSSEMNNNYNNTNGQKYLRVTLANIQTIPPSGRIDITIELPPPLSNFVQVPPCGSTVVQVRTHSPVGNGICITENVSVTNARHYALEHLRSPPMDYLTVDEGFRPRSNSDSRVDINRLKPGSRTQSKRQLPGIMIEDFSSGKTALRRALEGQPDDLRRDLDDDAEFFSMLNSRRRRSFTCPDKVISRPSSAELHRGKLY